MLDASSSAHSERIGRDTYIQIEWLPIETVLDGIETELRAGRRVWVSGRPFESLAARVGHRRDGRSWVIFTPRGEGRAHALGRIRDVIVSALALLVLSPFLGLIALVVALSSRGPVLYSAKVVGEGRMAFTWFKFLSMLPVPAEEDERKRKERYRAFAKGRHAGDPTRAHNKVIDETRVTRVGRVLRKYSLDEFPQLVNVLKGQMALVGPRPCLPYEAELFPKWALRRFDVRPGLTGVWQVYGRGRVGLEESLAMDVYYVYARSFWLDCGLILRTIAIVLKGEGAR